jgi:hypothetical protein
MPREVVDPKASFGRSIHGSREFQLALAKQKHEPVVAFHPYASPSFLWQQHSHTDRSYALRALPAV